MKRLMSCEELGLWRKELVAAAPTGVRFRVCSGTGCLAAGAEAVFAALSGECADVDFVPCKSGCHGYCEEGPLVVAEPAGILYRRVKPEHAALIVTSARRGEAAESLAYRDGGKEYIHENDIPFYAHQTRTAMALCGHIDPMNIGDYVAAGGYGALAAALSMSSADIVREIKESGLRGRGGGGFSAGAKWESCASARLKHRFVLANGDEGDPGAFMDRSLMEGNPHGLIEGMIIGARAVGARKGFIYVRAEYPMAVRILHKAIDDAVSAGLLGRNILGSGMDFDLEVCKGGGAFVCGESTALMASIEGRPGEPRVKYIRSTERGLWDCPTVLNNIETWVNVPIIINRGAEVFRKVGTEGSSGTKVFSLVGKVKNSGLVEVPMGTTLRKIIFDIGGGVMGRGHFKAVQTGGPSGGCLPEEKLDSPVDFDRLLAEGSMMGSGGMIVMDNRSCMVDVALYFVNFLAEESCGKCVPCREGLVALKEILSDLTSSKGQAGDPETLRRMGEAINAASLCGLGQSAANPVLSTLRYFHDEYREHAEEKFCRAGVCRGMYRAAISAGCVGCGACMRACTYSVIGGEPKRAHHVTPQKCRGCGACLEVCPVSVITPVRRGA